MPRQAAIDLGVYSDDTDNAVYAAYRQRVADPKATIDFDSEADARARERARRVGSDGLMVCDADDRPVRFVMLMFLPNGRREISPAILRDLFGLTRAQAAVACSLYEGRSVEATRRVIAARSFDAARSSAPLDARAGWDWRARVVDAGPGDPGRESRIGRG